MPYILCSRKEEFYVAQLLCAKGSIDKERDCYRDYHIPRAELLVMGLKKVEERQCFTLALGSARGTGGGTEEERRVVCVVYAERQKGRANRPAFLLRCGVWG